MVLYIAPYIGTILYVTFLSSFNDTTVLISKYSKNADRNNYSYLTNNSVVLNPTSPMKNQLVNIDVTWTINIEDRQVQPLNLTLVFDNFSYDWSYEFVETLPHNFNDINRTRCLRTNINGLFPYSHTLTKTYKTITPRTISSYSSPTLNSNVFITVSQISSDISRNRPSVIQFHS